MLRNSVAFIYPYISCAMCVSYIYRERVFARGSEDRGSIPGRVIAKTKKMVLHVTLLRTQQYLIEVWIKGKLERSWEWSCDLPYTSMKREPLGYPQLRSPTFLHTHTHTHTYIYIYIYIYIERERERERILM